MSDLVLRSSVLQRIVMQVAAPAAILLLVGFTVFGAILFGGNTQAATAHVSNAPDVIASAIIGGLTGFCIGILVPAVVLTLSTIEKNTRNIALMLERLQHRSLS
jgi:hypothetical protein